MAGSSFGTLFRVTTFGESHCRGVGAIVDGCPPCMRLTEADIQPQLTRRRPGQSRLTTPRSETDQVTILSGTEGGVTLGTPIGLFVPNENVRPQDYAEINVCPRPGHADYTYTMKYGVRASSGGGRASARETIGRVAAGAIAEKWLRESYGTEVVTFVSSVGTVDLPQAVINAGARDLDTGRRRAFTRADVDTLGTLTVLRDAPVTGWTRVPVPVSEPIGEAAAAPAAAAASAGSSSTRGLPGGPAAAATGAAGTAGSSAAAEKAAKAKQAAADAADEAAFVAAYRRRGAAATGTAAAGTGAAAAATATAAPAAYAPGTPAYEDVDGLLYDLDGTVVGWAADAKQPLNARAALALSDASDAAAATSSSSSSSLAPFRAVDVSARRSDEVVALRCPHAPTAARMATLIRVVKSEDDSTGGVLTTVISNVPIGEWRRAARPCAVVCARVPCVVVLACPLLSRSHCPPARIRYVAYPCRCCCCYRCHASVLQASASRASTSWRRHWRTR